MSKIEVNTIEPQCGTTLTLGGSGDTVALGSGASQTGFGRTGTVDWITTPKVTGDSPITAVTGKGYFLNTTAGTITVNLPAGAAGSIVSLADYAATWQTNNVTVNANGTEKIGGVGSVGVTLNTEGQSVTFVYVDSTQGWINTMDSTSNVRAVTYIAATVSGACNAIVTSGDFKTAIFKGPGTFCVSSLSSAPPTNTVDYMVVAGGGGSYGGGGGAGGFRMYSTAPGCNSPLNNYGASPNTEVTVTASPYTITVGGSGATSPASPPYCGPVASAGGLSTFSTVTSAGGGRGGNYTPGANPNSDGCGGAGGAGGGGGYTASGSATVAGGTGNSPPVAPSQGFAGGTGKHCQGVWSATGGGGGAAAVGINGAPGVQSNGGAGSYIADTFIGPTAPSYGETGPVGSTRYFAGGGGGDGPTSPVGGVGGGGDPPGGNGVINTGGGGAGAGTPSGAGGSGIVMIRYRFQ